MKYKVESVTCAWFDAYVEAGSEQAAEELAEPILEEALSVFMAMLPELKEKLARIGAGLGIDQDRVFELNGAFQNEEEEAA